MQRVAFILLLLSSFSLVAQPTTEEAKKNFALEILDVWGFKSQLERSITQIHAKIDGAKLDNESKAKLKDQLSQVFDPTELTAEYAREISERVPEKAIKYVHRWHKTKLGSAINSAELKGGDPSQEKAMIQFMKTKAPMIAKDSERAKLIASINKIRRTKELSIALVTAQTEAMMIAINPKLGKDKKELLKMRTELEKKLSTKMENAVRVSSLFIYRGLTIRALRKYEKVLQKKPMRKFYDTFSKIALDVISKRATILGESIKELAH